MLDLLLLYSVPPGMQEKMLPCWPFAFQRAECYRTTDKHTSIVGSGFVDLNCRWGPICEVDVEVETYLSGQLFELHIRRTKVQERKNRDYPRACPLAAHPILCPSAVQH